MPTKINVSHKSNVVMWLLNSNQALIHEIVDAGSKDEKAGDVEFAVTVNGIELDVKDLEEAIEQYIEVLKAKIKKDYSGVEALVQTRLEERIKEEVEPIVEKLNNLNYALDEVENVIVPYWEKTK